MDSRRSPQRVGEAHLADQPANVQRHVSAAAASRFPAPIRSGARAVPSYNSVRLNDRKRTTGLSEQPVKTNENQSVNWVESELARRPSPKHIDSLPQDQNLGLKRSSRPEKIREHPPDQSAQVQHHATASPDSQSTTSRIWFAVGTGRKRTHWIWFVFPQVEGLAHSEMSNRYSIPSAAEGARHLWRPVAFNGLVGL